MARYDTGYDFPAEALQTPPCPYFEECGACSLQHLRPDAYRKWKEDGLHELLAQNGLAPEEWLPSAFIDAGQRRRVTLSMIRDDAGVRIGYNKYHENEVVGVSSCLLLVPSLEKILKRLPDLVAPLLPKGQVIDLLLQEDEDGQFDCVMTGIEETGARQTNHLARLAEECSLCRISFRKDDRSFPVPVISLKVPYKVSGALRVELPAGAFLQPSRAGESILVDAVMQALEPLSLGKKDKVADLFSGCGTFAGMILKKSMVHAVEADPAMADLLVRAAKGTTRLTAERRDLYKEPMVGRELRQFRAVVLDPPRAGAKEQCRILASSSVPLIVYVSCHPATFARDAVALVAGGYKFRSARMVDQFTWSTHTEIVGVFEKN